MNVQQPPPLNFIWHGDSDSADTDEAWLVEEMLFEVGVALISGQWGTYKTFVAIDLAASAITGSSFAGREVHRQGGVLWLAAEGQNQVKVRIDGVAARKIATFFPAEDRAPIDPNQTPFAWMRGCPKLSDPRAHAELTQIIAAASTEMTSRFGLPLALVVIDAMTSAALFKDASASSESAQVMRMLNDLAHQFKLLIVVIDHYGKDVSTGTRDSSVKEDLADTILALLGERGANGLVTNPRMALRKCKGGENGLEIAFAPQTIELPPSPKGKPRKTLTLEWQDSSAGPLQAKAAHAWPKSLVVFRDVLNRMLCDHGKKIRPFSDGPEVVAITRQAVRQEFIKTYPADTLKAKTERFRACERNAQAIHLICAREIDGEQYYWRLDVK
jgi:hypothetical protein